MVNMSIFGPSLSDLGPSWSILGLYWSIGPYQAISHFSQAGLVDGGPLLTLKTGGGASHGWGVPPMIREGGNQVFIKNSAQNKK